LVLFQTHEKAYHFTGTEISNLRLANRAMNPRYETWVYLFVSSVACCLFFVVAYCYFAPAPASVIHVADAEIEIDDGYANQKRALAFKLENRSSQSVWVVGLSGC
jgi:hypothetical protein